MLKKLLVLSLLVAFIIGCEGYASSPTPKTDRTYLFMREARKGLPFFRL